MAQIVLIVDDESMTRDLLRLMLRPAGYEICEAEDGVDALEKIEQHRPDVVLLDVMMPRLDGLSTCQRLRTQQETQNLPVIMFSANTSFSAIEEGMAAGASRYLTKPVARRVLIDTIQEFLGKPGT